MDVGFLNIALQGPAGHVAREAVARGGHAGRVLERAILDEVRIVLDRVRSGAEETVVSAAAVQHVAAVTSEKGVVPALPLQEIVAVTTIDDVIRIARLDDVVAVVGLDDVLIAGRPVGAVVRVDAVTLRILSVVGVDQVVVIRTLDHAVQMTGVARIGAVIGQAAEIDVVAEVVDGARAVQLDLHLNDVVGVEDRLALLVVRRAATAGELLHDRGAVREGHRDGNALLVVERVEAQHLRRRAELEHHGPAMGVVVRVAAVVVLGYDQDLAEVVGLKVVVLTRRVGRVEHHDLVRRSGRDGDALVEVLIAQHRAGVELVEIEDHSRRHVVGLLHPNPRPLVRRRTRQPEVPIHGHRHASVGRIDRRHAWPPRQQQDRGRDRTAELCRQPSACASSSKGHPPAAPPMPRIQDMRPPPRPFVCAPHGARTYLGPT